MQKRYFFVPLVIAMFVFGTGILFGKNMSNKYTGMLLNQLSQNEPRRENHNEFVFINPLLTCIFPESVEFEEYADLEDTVQQAITSLQTEGQIETMSYYFSNLENGRWVGIDEMAKFQPASLFKVPAMMSYYKAAEEHPEILTEKIVASKTNTTNPLTQSKIIEPGQSYTVNELIELMITGSDNTALNMLTDQVDYSVLRELFLDLGIPFPDDDTGEIYTISPREYSLFFRVLYNGTYLSHDYSEAALQLLSESTFEHGIDTGLPEDVVISHKFGERGIYSDVGTLTGYELHDCGIVYISAGNYFLCVFTSGKDIDGLADAIRQISELSYSATQQIATDKK